ncbi:hypothetical protein [Streptomyces sp. NPDC058632]
MAALILTAGVFGDVHGREKLYQVGMTLSAASPSSTTTSLPGRASRR